MFLNIAEAIRFIHGKNIVHRDLKPDNVLLDDVYAPKLADFGLCSLSKSGKLLRTPCGSPLYAPPEILINQGYEGKSADIWSLGILLYTMVTGTLPWTTDNRIQLFEQIKRADIDIPAHLSPALQDLLANMLQRDPTRRYSIEEVLESPWFPKGALFAGLERSSSDLAQRPVPGHRCSVSSHLVLLQSRRLIVRPRRSTPVLGLPHAFSVRPPVDEFGHVTPSLSSGPWS
jgi:serine/threonine protein kinase